MKYLFTYRKASRGTRQFYRYFENRAHAEHYASLISRMVNHPVMVTGCPRFGALSSGADDSAMIGTYTRN